MMLTFTKEKQQRTKLSVNLRSSRILENVMQDPFTLLDTTKYFTHPQRSLKALKMANITTPTICSICRCF